MWAVPGLSYQSEEVVVSSNIVGNTREIGELFCDFDLLGRVPTSDEEREFGHAVASAFARLAEKVAGKGKTHTVAVFCGWRVRGPVAASPLSRSHVRVIRVFIRDDEAAKVVDVEELLSLLRPGGWYVEVR